MKMNILDFNFINYNELQVKFRLGEIAGFVVNFNKCQTYATSISSPSSYYYYYKKVKICHHLQSL